MDKLKMKSENLVDSNIDKIAAVFPNCVTEGKNEKGEIIRVVDFELLKQELSKDIVEGTDERYTLNWAGKKQSILTANAPIAKTLRPCREESVDFDSTQNLYIEGDNLDVLKLLRETYLNKVKMIYIDPPYNTGNDFVYEDDFADSSDSYFEKSKSFDEQGNRLFQNNDANGRFHSDWLSMMFSRLRLAKDLLTDDGVIFISIDENEVHNMRKLCDEVFGAQNFISQLGWQKVYAPKNQARFFSNDYEFILCYCHSIDNFNLRLLPRTAEMNARYKNPDNDPRGDWKAGDCVGSGVRKNGYYEVISPSGKNFNVPQGKHWVYAPDTMKQLISENRIWFGKDGNSYPAVKQFLSEVSGRRASNLLLHNDYGHTDMAKKDLIKLFQELEKVPFDTPKPVKLLKMLSILGTNKDDLILDFFSGSATMAQSILELNAEENSNRRFILVQIAEPLTGNDEAIEKGLKTISDVAKERIRRAGKKIQAENQMTAPNLDIGFRVLKLDTTCMKDVYYAPSEVDQGFLSNLESNIKEDRTAEDLLFQVMLDMGVVLSSNIEERKLIIENGKLKNEDNIHNCPLSTVHCQLFTIYNVNDNNLICCFDSSLTDDVVTQIAKLKPLYAVFRDSSMESDSTAVNFDQIFSTYSPTTTRRVI